MNVVAEKKDVCTLILVCHAAVYNNNRGAGCGC